MEPTREILITRSTRLDRNAVLNARLIIRASHVVIDGSGATLDGPAQPGDLASYESAGIGVRAEGVSDPRLRHRTRRTRHGMLTDLRARVDELPVRSLECCSSFTDYSVC
jgi:hypothetical protein